MNKDREPKFTPGEDLAINYVAAMLREGGEEAISELRDTRFSYSMLAYKIGREGGSAQDMRAAKGRTAELANEAIKRAKKVIEEMGEDEVSQLLAQIEEKKKSK